MPTRSVVDLILTLQHQKTDERAKPSLMNHLVSNRSLLFLLRLPPHFQSAPLHQQQDPSFGEGLQAMDFHPVMLLRLYSNCFRQQSFVFLRHSLQQVPPTVKIQN